ncbi:MAG: tetratricopeptide repeat protein, partial [Planctomycetia bacterium]|nr:tetratricopeptide repeat protein [Planctomycetia bacterium]
KLFSSARSIFQFHQEDRSTVRHFLKLHIISLCELAWKLENTNRWEEAADLYRSALIAGGADSSISFQLAELLQRQKDYPGARERYYVVLESDRDNIEARANLGRVLRELGETAKAIDAFQGALALYPDYLDVHYELGCLLFQNGNKEEAGEHLRRYLNGSPDGPQTDHAIEMLNSK